MTKKNRQGRDRWSYGSTLRVGETNGFWEVWANELLDAEGKYIVGGYNINGYQSTVEAASAGRRKSDYTVWEPAFGGTYDWSKMPAVPDGSSADEELLEIGRICRDVGLTVPVWYDGWGGGASSVSPLALSLVDTFQYADAKFKSSVTADDIKNCILANLDAKLPVGVVVPGHAIVADGYGYMDGEIYVHFNFGWGGGGSWYNPPVLYEGATLGGANDKYNTIYQLLYNVYPEGAEGASIVSGRVLGKNGSPVTGVTVSAGGSRSCATDSNGIYALFLQPGEHYISVASGTTVARTNLVVAATSNPTIIYNDGVTTGGASVGNIWGVDLTLAEASETELGWVNETADTTGRTGTWSVPVAYDATAKTAEVGESDMFTATTPSGGAAVTVEVTAKLCGENGETPPNAAQAAIRLGTNGCFQVWMKAGNGEQVTGNRWVDVEAEGVTPSADVEYTFRFSLDYAAGTYSVEVGSSTGFTKLREVGVGGSSSTLQLETPTQNSGFPIATSTNAVSAIGFRGSGTLRSILGTYFESFGFRPGEVTGSDAAFVLDEAKAAWLKGLGDYATVSGKVATLTAEKLGEAYLLNLDVTSEEYDGTYAFKVTSITVEDGKATIGVLLERKGSAAQATNGVLKFYGSGDLSEWTHISDAALSDDDFSNGDAATAEIDLGDNPPNFFKAKVEER